MRTGPRRSRMTTVIVLVVISSIWPSGGAFATHTDQCGPTTQYGWASHGRGSSQGKRIAGISAEFQGQSIDLCTGSTNAARNSYMWVAIEGSCGGSGNCIMQVGMGRAEPAQTMGWWYAWGRSPLAPGCEGYSDKSPGIQRLRDWNGAQVTYQITFVPPAAGGIGKWSFRVDGTERFGLAYGQICWRHSWADWFGEAMNRGSAIGGWPNDHLRAYANRYRVMGEDTWYGPFWSQGLDCRIQNPKPPYHCRQSTSDQLEYWTDHP